MEERRDGRVEVKGSQLRKERMKGLRTEGFTVGLAGGGFHLRFARVRIAVALVLQLRASLEKLQNQGIRPSSHFASTDNLIHVTIGEAGVDSSRFHPGGCSLLARCCGGVDDGEGKYCRLKKLAVNKFCDGGLVAVAVMVDQQPCVEVTWE